MLVIRLFRVGKKNQPAFKIVVTDKRKSATKGVYVEEVGFWNPLTKEKVLQKERIKYWISIGAKPSATVHNLLISEKIVEGKKIPVHKKKKLKEGAVEAEKTVAPVAQAETPSTPESSKKEEPKTEIPKEEAPAQVKTSPAAETPKKEESKTEPPKEEEPLKEDESSSRPSPSEEGSGAEGKTPGKPAETSRPEAPEEEEKEKKAESLTEIK